MSGPTDERFFRTGHWVVIEDQYDHDTIRYGRFPSQRAAEAFCDAYNGRQLRRSAGAPPKAIRSATDVGVWELARTDGYDPLPRLLDLLAHPEQALDDPDALRARHDVRPESVWRAEWHAAHVPARCWCASLARGDVPDARPEAVEAWLFERLSPHRALFGTTPHFGDASLCRCGICGGAVLHLLVELESFGDAIHHYYAPLDAAAVDALEKGTLHAGNLEVWLGERAGVHRHGDRVCLDRRARVGYPGLDHAILA